MPGIDKPRKSRMMADSPLLNSDHANEAPSSYRSTINAEKFDLSRFSEMKEQEESSLRIIIYVIVVIVLGVGAALGVRKFLLNDEEPVDTVEDTADTTDNAIDDVVNVDIVASLDSQASNKSLLEDYVDSELLTVGSAEANLATVSISQLSYKRYTTFGRLSLTAEGLTTTNTFPQTEIAFDSTSNVLTIDLNEVITVVPDLNSTITINDLVKQITFDATANKFSVTFAKASKYSVQIIGNSLVIDVKTNEQLETDMASGTQEEETTTPEVTETPTTTTPSGATNYDNDFSQSKQSIVSKATSASISQDIFFYEDAGSYFEFAFGTKDKAGENYIPNATAELITSGGKNYIELKISNLSKEVFQSYGISGTALTQSSVDLSGANFVRIDLVSFSGGVATYRIELKNKADFRLLSEPTVDKSTQVVSIQIKD